MLYFQLSQSRKASKVSRHIRRIVQVRLGCHNSRSHSRKSGQIDCDCWSRGPVANLRQEEVIQELPNKGNSSSLSLMVEESESIALRCVE
jgi:hypothetical protein